MIFRQKVNTTKERKKERTKERKEEESLRPFSLSLCIRVTDILYVTYSILLQIRVVFPNQFKKITIHHQECNYFLFIKKKTLKNMKDKYF